MLKKIGIMLLIMLAFSTIHALASNTSGKSNHQPKQPHKLDRDELPNVPDHVIKHLCLYRIGDTDNENSSTLYFIHLKGNGPRVELDDYPGSESLVAAAWYYAMENADYEVTVGDVLENGYFPYSILPPDINLDLLIRGMCDFLLSYDDFENFGSDSWKLKMKHKVLTAFYHEYYFPYNPSPEHLESLIMPEELTLYPGFWINPMTGLESELGRKMGCLVEHKLIGYKSEYSNVSSDDKRRKWVVKQFMFRDCPSLAQE